MFFEGIPFDTLLTFNRLKSLSEDKSVIVNALKKSDSNLLEISECLTKIRRNSDRPLPEFDEKYTQDLNERTVHLKGFPVDTKLDDVMTFCKQFGVVENIEMRRHFKTKKFKVCLNSNTICIQNLFQKGLYFRHFHQQIRRTESD